MIRIAYILPSLANRGPIIVVQNLVNKLVLEHSQNFEITVFYLDPILELNFSCPCIHLNTSSKSNLKNIFSKFDIIHSHGFRPDCLVAGLGNINIRSVSTIHSDIYKDLYYTYNIFISIFAGFYWLSRLKKTDLQVFTALYVRRVYAKSFPKSCFIHNGVNPAYESISQNMLPDEVLLQIHKDKAEGKKVMGTYAALTKIKGIHQLIDFIATDPSWSLIIIGEGKEKKNLRDQVEKNGLGLRVHFFGFQLNVRKYLSEFDIYSIPSYSEGFGLALIEASLSKIPIVCSKIPVFEELFSNEEVNFFTLDNPESFKLAVEDAMAQKEKKVEKAYCRSIQSYTDSVMASKYKDMYLNLLGCK